MHRERMLALANALDTGKISFDMAEWGYVARPGGGPRIHDGASSTDQMLSAVQAAAATNCQVTACMAGHAVLMFDLDPLTVSAETVESTALELLGLTEAQGHRMFYAARWPADLRTARCEAESNRLAATSYLEDLPPDNQWGIKTKARLDFERVEAKLAATLIRRVVSEAS